MNNKINKYDRAYNNNEFKLIDENPKFKPYNMI